MFIVRATIVTLLLVIPSALATPGLARPNDGRFQRSPEANLMRKADACDLYKGLLDIAEKEADKRAGTKAAAPYAKEADSWWAAGAREGCGWAK